MSGDLAVTCQSLTFSWQKNRQKSQAWNAQYSCIFVQDKYKTKSLLLFSVCRLQPPGPAVPVAARALAAAPGAQGDVLVLPRLGPRAPLAVLALLPQLDGLGARRDGGGRAQPGAPQQEVSPPAQNWQVHPQADPTRAGEPQNLQWVK